LFEVKEVIFLSAYNFETLCYNAAMTIQDMEPLQVR